MRLFFQARLLVIVIVGVASATAGLIESARRSAQVKDLEASLPDFLAQPGKRMVDCPRLAGRKVVCVCLTDKAFDAAEYELPDALHAATPAEVAAVVKVARRDEVVGQYGENGPPACRRWADVLVIEKSSGRVIAERSFRGGEPPRTNSPDYAGKGSVPAREIADWLGTI